MERAGTAAFGAGRAGAMATKKRGVSRSSARSRSALLRQRDTPGAAHALARCCREDIAVIPPGGVLRTLSPLPVAALRLEEAALGAARKFGFETVADLLPVARGPLARRLGMATIDRLDQALGGKAEPITPREDVVIPEVERRLLEPIGTAEAIAQVMQRRRYLDKRAG